jgi:uracil-DNA glycosylase
MSGRDELRRYLEQRRDLGEREFTLDDLSVEDALSMLGAKRPSSSAASKPAAGGTGRKFAFPAPDDLPAAAVPGESRRTVVPAPARPLDPAMLPEDAPPWLAAIGAPLGLRVGDARTGRTTGAIGALDSLDAVARAAGACTGCALHASATNVVPGEGDPAADFVCVGEAPGANEDATGRPFVGQSGELLTKILGAITLSREQVFICNVLKHRPPGNRNPTPEEVQVCSPFLLRQLELLRPKVILTLGTYASQTLLATKQPIGQLRGHVHRYYGIPLIVTYHPAALLRNPAWKRPTWEDVQLARRILDTARAHDAA